MNVLEALDAWQAQYSGQPPVGFMLRFTHEAAWTRIHYLRNGSEPATNEDDRRTASRFDAVSSSLFNGTTVLVLATHLDPRREDTAELQALGAMPIAAPESWVEMLSGVPGGSQEGRIRRGDAQLAARLPGSIVAGGCARPNRSNCRLLPGHR